MFGTRRTAPARAPRPVPRSWWVVLVLSLLIAAYGANYASRGEAAFIDELAASFRARPWAIISHATFGTLALLTGPLQFRADLRARFPRFHRVLGRAYVVAALGTGTTGLFMAAFSFGGMVTHLGFGTLAVLMLTSTGMAFARIKAGDVTGHRAWMLRSFALMFAGVMLRIELPLLIAAYNGQFEPAYRIVAWLSWVPNVVWAEWWLRRRGVAVRKLQEELVTS